MSRRLLPLLHLGNATETIRIIEDRSNCRQPARAALAYTIGSFRRDCTEFLSGRAAIEAFLARKRVDALDHPLIKEVRAFSDDRISATVRQRQRTSNLRD
jgi:nuclear transport factor 2 (NTF2) superfamily protein